MEGEWSGLNVRFVVNEGGDGREVVGGLSQGLWFRVHVGAPSTASACARTSDSGNLF